MPDNPFALWPAEATLNALLEANDAAIVGVSIDGMVLGWNTAASRFFGFEAVEIIGQPLFLLIPEPRTCKPRVRAGNTLSQRCRRRIAASSQRIALPRAG